jgi:hypothetical protein
MGLTADHTEGAPNHVIDHNLIDETLLAVIAGSGRALPSGETALMRSVAAANTVGTASGVLKLSYFTALKTETITQVRLYVGAVAAASTPTLCRIGIWSASDNGALTALVASTANDTTLLTGTTNSRRTKSLSASLSKTLGQRYAVGVLVRLPSFLEPSPASARKREMASAGLVSCPGSPICRLLLSTPTSPTPQALCSSISSDLSASVAKLGAEVEHSPIIRWRGWAVDHSSTIGRVVSPMPGAS